MSKEIKEQFILVKIQSREDAKSQLAQMLADELKAETIQGYEVEPIESIKYQVSESYDSRIVGTYDDESEAQDKFDECQDLADGGDYNIEKIIS